MRSALEAAWNAVTLAAALAILAFILWFALRSHAHMWRLASSRYRRKAAPAAIDRKLETVVIAARGLRVSTPFSNRAHRRYPVMVGIHRDGLSVSHMPPFNLVCPPLFLPFDEMDLKPTDWALWREPFAIRMRQLPDVDIIVGRVTVGWMREHIDRAPFGLGV